MKRVLAILAVCMFGFTGLAQFSGSWTTELSILPEVGLKESVLTLNYEVAGWTLTSESKFTGDGFVGQAFSFAGPLAIFPIEGRMAFDPAVAAYKSARVKTEWDFAGVSFDLTVSHEPDPFKMEYELGVAVAPVSAELTFLDESTGIAFEALEASVDDLPLFSSGLTYDVELSFTRAGFGHLKFSIIPLVEIWDISLGVDVEFTTVGKEVTPILDWQGIIKHVTVWGDVVGLEPPEVGIVGLEIYGYRIHCELGEGNYLEIVTAFDVGAVEGIIGDVFEGAEYQYLKLGFADPVAGWELGTRAFFQETGPLFGISRLGIDASVPVIPDVLAFNIAYTSALAPAPPTTTLDIGWTFTF